MNVLVTGATGQVGNRLGQELVRQGMVVSAVVRNKTSAPASLSYPARLYDWTELNQAVRGQDVIIHLAGENIAGKRWSKKRKIELRSSRVDTARALERACKEVEHKAKVVIAASAIGIYGDRKDEILEDDAKMGEGFIPELCREWEDAGRAIPSSRTVTLRFGVVLAKSGGFLRQVVPLFRAIGASTLGNGKQYVSWVHIEDLVAVVLKAIREEQMNGVYNLCSPEPVTNSELTKILTKQLQAVRMPAAPGPVLKLMYGEMSAILLNSQRVVPSRLKRAGYAFRFARLEAALEEIYPGMEPGEMQSYFESWVDATPAKVWEFFSSETNLEEITPPSLKFHVEKKSTAQVNSGTVIEYRLKIHGVPAKWRTLIEDWRPPKRFCDRQLKGPYVKWFHEHDFEPLGTGVLLRDTVHWRMPLGQLGRTTALWYVLKDVEGIFRYRAETISRIFGPRSSAPKS